MAIIEVKKFGRLTVCDNTEILGGLEYIPRLELKMDQSGDALLVPTSYHQALDGTPMDEWHGRRMAWSNVLTSGCRVYADIDEVCILGAALEPLLDRVHAGHTVEWDGSNMVGRLTDDAEQASWQIDGLLNSHKWTLDTQISEPGDHLDRLVFRDFEITENTSDDELKRIAAEIVEEAKANEIEIVGGVAAVVEWLKAERPEVLDL